MKRKPYIKDLEYILFINFGKKYLTVSYIRNNEYNKYTLGKIPEWVRDEKTVRKFLNK